ncbi:hypothetical protein ACIA8O_36030 [Kitasatospora sp. NPDC051853]|uniref:hypothetical protein n=1 Tax=Kitasatospora sp. NPDC051853 TaxID=3364058 RepID=UPI0037896DD2
MIDIVSKLSALPKARPFPGIPGTWEWSPSPVFRLMAMVGSDGRHVFRLNTKDSYDADLCRAVLEFVRERESEAIERAEPLIALPGFSWPGRDFDVVGRLRPEAHHLHADDPELHDSVLVVFPAYSTEISGAETVEQAAERYRRMLRTPDLNRGPSPYVLIRFDNPKSGAGTTGDLPVFTSPDYLVHELRELEGVPEGHLELWTYRNEQWCVRWEDGWIVTTRDGEIRMSADEVTSWAMATIS